jgi:(p)ppGpp synthase/HD superfamily hydrolase
MIYSEQIQKAIRFSTKTHEVYQKQKRKGKDIPYITHPLIVGLILARAGTSEDVIIAGILHDAMEDSVADKKVTKEMIAERFGNRVADIVESVTEPNKELSWEERKEEAYRHIAGMPHDSLLVKSADLLSNISDIITDHKAEGDWTFSRFNAPMGKIIAHYMRMIVAIGKEWPGNPLNEDLQSLKLAPVFAPQL